MTKNELEQRNADIEALLQMSLERETKLQEQLRQQSEPKPSAVRNLWVWCKPYIITIILVMIVCGQFVYIATQTKPVVNQQTSILEQQAALGGAAIPFQERSAIADALELAAGELDRGTERLVVDEYIREVIAQQPTGGQWKDSFTKILQTAASPDPVKYAENLRAIAKGLKQ